MFSFATVTELVKIHYRVNNRHRANNNDKVQLHFAKRTTTTYYAILRMSSTYWFVDLAGLDSGRYRMEEVEVICTINIQMKVFEFDVSLKTLQAFRCRCESFYHFLHC